MTRIFHKKIFSSIKVIVSVFLIFYLLLAASVFENEILASKTWRKKIIFSPVFDMRQTFSVFFQNIMTSGMRNIMADLLLIQVHDLWHQGRWYRIPANMEMITMLHPYLLEFFVMGSWHMAYNVTTEILRTPFLSDEQKKKDIFWWEQRALNMLRSGIILNSDRHELYFQLAWTYYHRMHDYDNAIIYYRRAQRFPDHYDYVERHIAYSYEKKGQVKKALVLMRELRKDESYHHNEDWLINILDKNIKRMERKVASE